MTGAEKDRAAVQWHDIGLQLVLDANGNATMGCQSCHGNMANRNISGNET